MSEGGMNVQTVLTDLVRHIDFHKTFGEQFVDNSSSVAKRNCLGVCCEIN